MITSLSIALSVGVLFAAGSYLFMQRNALRVIVGFLLLSNGANLVFLAMSREPADRRAPLIVKEDLKYGHEAILLQPFADPLPQALILTAIVIGFGVLAFMIGLVYAAYAEQQTVLLGDLDEDPTGQRISAREGAEFPAAVQPASPPSPAEPAAAHHAQALGVSGGEPMSSPPSAPDPGASAVNAPPLSGPAASKPEQARNRQGKRRRR